MSFWYEFPEENKENDIRHPPLTGATVASIEGRYHVRFPRRLIALLREKNGGYLNNKEFKLKGKDYQVDSISGLAEPGWSVIESFSHLFKRLDDSQFLDQFPANFGNPDRVLIFGGYASHCLYALDYNKCNRNGEPRVLYLNIEGGIRAHEVAGGFDEFLDGQYLGDPAPSVHWDERANKTPALETHVSFQHKLGEAWLEQLHRVYRLENTLIVFTRSRWNERIRLRKATVRLKSLAPEFCNISKLDYAAGSDVFVLCLHVDPHRKWLDVEDSEQAGSLWKNTHSELLNDSIHASDRNLLDKFRRDLFPAYKGKPTSFTDGLNKVLKDIGIDTD